jgi:glucose uptake protein GlcU
MGKSVPEGFIGVALAVLFFGSNFVPIKKFETGDGMFFQWVMCAAIWIFGLIINAYQGFPAFVPLAMLGGFLWCTGNVMVVTIVKCIGLALGICLWGISNLIMGWFSGTFGLFGLRKQEVPNPAFNYVGFVFAVLSIVLYLFIKPEEKKVDEEEQKLIVNENKVQEEGSWVDKLNPFHKRILGVTLALISGIFYGTNFDPPQYVQDHGGSQNGLDYVFSHFTGIFITSTTYFLIYCILKKNRPSLYPQIVLPSFLSGVMWAVAQSSWFIANSNLDMVVAFPIISTGPSIVASIWGIFVFREIRGGRNFIILLLAFLCTIFGAIMISLSKF